MTAMLEKTVWAGWLLVAMVFATGCQLGGDVEAAPEPEPIEEAAFFDFQTRYLAEETADGFDLTVFVNARGRGFNAASLALVRQNALLVCERIAQRTDKALPALDLSGLPVVVKKHRASGQMYWQTSTHVTWASPRPRNGEAGALGAPNRAG